MGQARHPSHVTPLTPDAQQNKAAHLNDLVQITALARGKGPARRTEAPACAVPARNHAGRMRGVRPFSPLIDRLVRRKVTIAGKNGHLHLARPINESDAGALMRCYDAMTERGKWFRMLHHLPHLSEDMARDFCSPDPDKDLCIVLEGDGPLAGEILGGARITGSADGKSAEYSVTLRPEAEGLGLAHKALELVFAAAKEMGYTRIWGAIHSENGPMLQLAESLDLNLRRDPNDAALMVSEGDL
ncbi:MAG: GNAT family N-acetyltransferase [Pseudomonadota bacterium]